MHLFLRTSLQKPPGTSWIKENRLLQYLNSSHSGLHGEQRLLQDINIHYAKFMMLRLYSTGTSLIKYVQP
jgi:hypothetical protein